MGLHILEIEKNAENSLLAILSPADENEKLKSGYRIAGPKAWGGSNNLATLKIDSEDLIIYITSYAPEVIEGIKLRGCFR